MARSNRLRLGDVKKAFRLVGECRDLGHDPAGWLSHAAEGVQRLLKAKLVVAAITPPAGYHLNQEIPLMVNTGWDRPEQQQIMQEYLRDEAQLADPAFHGLRRVAKPNITVRPARLVSARSFRSGESYALRTQSLEVEDFIFSQRLAQSGTVSFGFSPNRAVGDRAFSSGDVRLLGLLHDELARLVGAILADHRDGPLVRLTPRLRQTLEALLEGDSEKQIALRLQLSRHTIHEYVVELYRRFGVHSRAELLAIYVRRHPT
jgi:DNA-binding CsgD family transcriptional regulator